jgi:branched-chain amino acid transport system ATP-binding protein
LLTLSDVSTFYGKFEALRGVELTVAKGEMVGIIGANGAGKTTLLRTICGLERNRRGSVVLEGEDISLLSPRARVVRGVVYCPEDRKLFSDMTVLENLEMGAHVKPHEFKRNLERILEVFPILAEKRSAAAGSLSGGQQQMLAISRSLMSNPKLVMFDEPSTGLAPLIAEQLMSVIQGLNREGMTVLLVEQNVHLALGFVSRAYALENGQIVLQGSAKELIGNDEVRRSYLGV